MFKNVTVVQPVNQTGAPLQTNCVQLRLRNAGECSGMWVCMQWIEVNDLVISLIVPDWLKVF